MGRSEAGPAQISTYMPAEVSLSTPALAEQPSRPGRVPLVEVVITEAIDARAVPHLHTLLEDARTLRPEHLVVDLSGCPSIDASGIATLLELRRRSVRDGGRLSLRAPSSGVYRNLRLARAARAFDIIWPQRAVLAEDWCAAAGAGAAVPTRPTT